MVLGLVEGEGRVLGLGLRVGRRRGEGRGRAHGLGQKQRRGEKERGKRPPLGFAPKREERGRAGVHGVEGGHARACM
jgi:hypothetical protein